MKLIAGSLALLVGINLIFSHPTSAKFAHEDIKYVPIPRLLKNLEIQRSDVVGSTDRAMIDFRMGRLHAMAYALGVEEAPCNAQARAGSKYELPEFGHTPDHVQFRIDKSKSKIDSPQAKQHLQQAINSMQAALKIDPSLLSAKLGLGWCYQQAGEKAKAINLYREVFASAYEQEKDSKGGMYNWSIALETAEYLEKLLDPKKDKNELAQLQSKKSVLQKVPRMVTPIMIPLDFNVGLEQLLIKKTVEFDLDGFGAKQYAKWLSPKAAWLVFDHAKDGKINSGLKLVGQSSFWIFWKNGYEVLKSLDDDNNGILSGSELAGLALWNDINCNGISESGEVKPLAKYGIVGLKHDCKKLKDGVLVNAAGVLYRNGSSSASYDILLPTANTQAHGFSRLVAPNHLNGNLARTIR